jgi:dipeptidyl aminopeptidase/acylaminoacyl peptidase
VVVCTAGEGGALNADGDYAHISEHSPLLAAGFAVFTVDQRGAPGHGPDFSARAEAGGGDVDDVAAATRYLADLPQIDRTRINLVGTSRGAYTALLALERTPNLWHHAALLMGLYDPSTIASAEQVQPGSVLFADGELDAAEINAYFAAPHRQPLKALDALTAPLFIVHGDADPIVPVTQSEELAAQVWKAGLTAQLVTVPGLPHDSDHEDAAWVDLWPEIGNFLHHGPR